MNAFKPYDSFSLAHKDAAARFVRNYLVEEEPGPDGRAFRTALFGMGNGYYTRVWSPKTPEDARRGSFFYAVFARRESGVLQPIFYPDHVDGYFVKTEPEYCVCLATIVREMEKTAAMTPAPYADRPNTDPEFSPIPYRETPWRRSAARRENPADIRCVEFAVAPVAAREMLYGRTAGVLRALYAKKCGL